MKKFTLLVLAFAMFTIFSCEKDENSADIYMGIAYIGQSIPVDTKYTYSKDDYSLSIEFINATSYEFGQAQGSNVMPPMTIPCVYNSITGEFSNRMEATHDVTTWGQIQNFPTSFCIDDYNKLYLFTFDPHSTDVDLTFPRTIAEKTAGVAGTIEGSYQSSFSSDNWITITGDGAGTADMQLEAELNYTYGDGVFSGTLTTRNIMESDLTLPDYGIEPGSSDETINIDFNGTWEYNETDNTITETILSPVVETYTYTPYWVSYNNKLYLVTSLTRFYQKEDN